jgi:hypothetical protein
MIRYRQALLVSLFAMPIAYAVAQNVTNSPYTRYGYGQLADQGSGNSKAMGGIAYGLRDRSQINFANPASYTAIDSLTFIFDGGVALQNTNYTDGTAKKNMKNSSFDYITMQFRLGKRAAMSIGLLPYSSVGYGMTQVQEDPDAPANISAVTYTGSGGLHQLYIGAGVKLLKNLSVGANISYMWGDLSHEMIQTYSNGSAYGIYRIQTMSVSSYKLDFGAQYTQNFGKKHSATLGVVFSPGHNLGNTANTQTAMMSGSSAVSAIKKDTTVTSGIPMTLGAGITYMYDNRLTVGADVMVQNWNSTTFMNTPNAFVKRTRISVGAEYIPNLMGKSYFAHVKYRLGAYYTTPYYKVDGVRAAREYGVTFGFGLPLPMSRSLISLSGQYVRTKASQANFMDEQTLRICVGITFNERWFWKRKVQ